MQRKDKFQQVHSIADMRLRAQRYLPRAVFDFVDGGAEDERTLQANRSQFDRWKFVQRVPRDVSARSTKLTLLGRHLPAPILVAPMGMTGLVRPSSDMDIARAAARRGVPYTMSMAATSNIEQVGAIKGLNAWFQLYPIKDAEFAGELLVRAQTAGFVTLVVTVDAPVNSKRERDRRNGLTMPLRLTSRNVVDLAQRWGWLAAIARSGTPRLANLPQQVFTNTGTQAAYMAQQIDPSLTWERVKRIRDQWQGSLVVKGLLHADDALAAQAIGADAVVVSNHGGRQLDGAPAPLEVLPEIAAALRGQMPILCDSGFRRGAEIVRALALGASAVMLGRACLYGAAAGVKPGRAGRSTSSSTRSIGPWRSSA